VHDLAAIDAVLQQQVERATGKWHAAGHAPVPVDPHLADDAIAVERLFEGSDRAEFARPPPR
jgi:hypothetical protein